MILKPLTDHNWRGYTLEEIQEQSLINDYRIMAKKNAVRAKVSDLKGNSKVATTVNAFSVLMSYIDYIKMGISLFGKVKTLISNYRKKHSGATE